MAAGGAPSPAGASGTAGRPCRPRPRPSPLGSTALADGTDGGRPLARASINQALAAVTLAHRNAGHAFDRKHRVISMTWSGISRVKAMTEVERQASPWWRPTCATCWPMLNTARNIGCRNAALLTLGWGAALRRSELVGLDWEQIGEGGKGTGFVRIDERGILITLARSKASQDKAETVVIPRADLPEACEALEAWASARPAPARPADLPGGQQPQPDRRRAPHGALRLAHRQAAMRDLARRRGKSAAEAKDMVRRFSGHCSGRATPPAPRRPTCRRCASSSTPGTSRADMVARYVRESDKWSKIGAQRDAAPHGRRHIPVAAPGLPVPGYNRRKPGCAREGCRPPFLTQSSLSEEATALGILPPP